MRTIMRDLFLPILVGRRVIGLIELNGCLFAGRILSRQADINHLIRCVDRAFEVRDFRLNVFSRSSFDFSLSLSMILFHCALPHPDALTNPCGVHRLRQECLSLAGRGAALRCISRRRGCYPASILRPLRRHAPASNTDVADAVRLYSEHLSCEGPVSFDAISLETVIAAIKRAGAQ
jgi:hypothetical protein